MMSAAKSKVNPLTVNAFIGSLHEGLTIDDGFGLNELIGLALDLPLLRPGQPGRQTLPTDASSAFPGLGDVLAVDQPAAQEMLVNVFGSSLQTPTNPPPNENGYPRCRPAVTSDDGPEHRQHVGGGRSRDHHSDDGRTAAAVRPASLPPPLTTPAPPPVVRAPAATRAQGRRWPPRRAPGPARSSSRWRT